MAFTGRVLLNGSRSTRRQVKAVSHSNKNYPGFADFLYTTITRLTSVSDAAERILHEYNQPGRLKPSNNQIRLVSSTIIFAKESFSKPCPLQQRSLPCAKATFI